MRRIVVIATPSIEGRLDAPYVYALTETIKAGAKHDIEFMPLFVIRDALIQNARNDLLAMAYQSPATDMLWIDSDIVWKPEQALRLLSHPVDVVGGTYPHKHEAESYVVKADPAALVADANGLMKVHGLGCGFLRMSRKAMTHLWDTSPAYTLHGKERRWAFDVRPMRGELISEDIHVCMRLAEGGMPTFLDPSITCDHIGSKTYSGNFSDWAERLRFSGKH